MILSAWKRGEEKRGREGARLFQQENAVPPTYPRKQVRGKERGKGNLSVGDFWNLKDRRKEEKKAKYSP